MRIGEVKQSTQRHWTTQKLGWTQGSCQGLFISHDCYWILLAFPISQSSLSCQDISKSWLAAASLQSCLTLCDPIDGSPPGFSTHGVFQARVLEWGAIAFSNAWKWKVKLKLLSRVWLLATPWTVAHQTPLSMGFSRQEYWSGVLLTSPEVGLGVPFELLRRRSPLSLSISNKLSLLQVCYSSFLGALKGPKIFILQNSVTQNIIYSLLGIPKAG